MMTTKEHKLVDIPKTDDIIPKHGFASGLFGRRTRSFGSGGNGRWVAAWTVAFCGFGTIAEMRVDGVSESRWNGPVGTVDEVCGDA